MIMRTWRACTSEADADSYYEYMSKAGLKRVQTAKGNRGVFVVRRHVHGKAEFLVLSLWESMEAVHGFAGPDATRAVFNPDDEERLLEYDVTVRLYDVLSAPELPPARP